MSPQALKRAKDKSQNDHKNKSCDHQKKGQTENILLVCGWIGLGRRLLSFSSYVCFFFAIFKLITHGNISIVRCGNDFLRTKLSGKYLGRYLMQNYDTFYLVQILKSNNNNTLSGDSHCQPCFL